MTHVLFLVGVVVLAIAAWGLFLVFIAYVVAHRGKERHDKK